MAGLCSPRSSSEPMPAGESYSDVIIRVPRGLVRLVEPLIMAALFAAPIIAKEISRGRAITD